MPNSLLAGAAKSGTTSLFHYMKGHPQIYFSPVKEPCYFTAQFLEVDPAYRPDNLSQRCLPGGIPRWRFLNRFFLRKDPLQRTVRFAGSCLLTEERWVRMRETLHAKLLAKEQMKPETRRQLQEFFRDDIHRLQDLIGRDLGGWLA
jgi:hypothetical protein